MLFHLIILKAPMLHFQNPSQMFPEVTNHLRPIEIILHFSISQFTCLANKKYGPLKRLKLMSWMMICSLTFSILGT